MSLPKPVYYDPRISVATAVTAAVFSAPFPGVNSLYLLTQDYQQFRDDYSPLALNTAHPEFSDFILCSESPQQDIHGGIVQWTRTYAKVPASRTEGRSIAYPLPGLTFGGTNPLVVVSNVVADFTAGTVTVNTASAHGLIVGSKVFFFWGALDTNYKNQFVTAETVATVASTTRFTITPYQPFAATIQLREIQKANTSSFGNYGRKPQTASVSAVVQFDYFLTSDITTIAELNPVIIYDALGQVVDTYGTATTPTLQAYVAEITALNYVVAQASIARRWQGNIYERETVFVRAQ